MPNHFTKLSRVFFMLLLMLLVSLSALADKLSVDSAAVERGGQIVLVLPEGFSAAYWQSANTAVATVDQRGRVTGRKAGETTITATGADGKASVYSISVVQPVTRVKLPSSLSLERGASAQLRPAILPEDATDKALSFSSSDESVAAVNQKGLVTARSVGRAIITAEAASGRKASLRLTVTQPVTRISIDMDSFVLNTSDSRRLNAIIAPAEATDRTVRWSSSNRNIARVSASGIVTGRSPGIAVITAKASNGLTAFCTVTVLQPVTSVRLNPSHLNLLCGDAAKLTVSLGPANVTDKTIVWASSNPAVATVDPDGAVHGLSDGACVITATASNGKSATAKVTVTSVKVTGLTVDCLSAELQEGQQLKLNAAVHPSDATTQRVWFASCNPDIAAVDENGLVTALHTGQTVIMIATAEGGFSANCVVTVRAEEKKRLEGVVIGINPGHQTKGSTRQEPLSPGSSKTRNSISVGTSGAVTHTPEYEVNLQTSLKLRDLLESEGATVVMTRTTNDVFITNIQRATMLNNAHVDIALQIHCDGSEYRSNNGISMWVCDKGPYSDTSAEAAHCMLMAMLERTGAKNAGEKRSGSYMSLNYSTTPSVLVEMGFLSNAAEEQKLITDSYQQLLAEGMVEGICDWLGR